MKLSSEQVHHIGGAIIASVALLVLLFQLSLIQWPLLPYLLPLLLVGYGIESFLDTWIHGSAAPAHYGPESVQHLVQGAAVVVAGIAEALLLLGILQHSLWGLFLPLALIVVGAIFFIHAQHEAGAPALVLVVQHRVFALTLFVAAATKALSLIPGSTAVLASAWFLPFLLFGLELLIYTEGDSAEPHVNKHNHGR